MFTIKDLLISIEKARNSCIYVCFYLYKNI